MKFVRTEGKGVNQVTVYQMSEEERQAYIEQYPIEPKDRTEDYR